MATMELTESMDVTTVSSEEHNARFAENIRNLPAKLREARGSRYSIERAG
jgi:hypothetical protein